MAIILNNKKSTYSSPYAYYTVETTNIENRTATSVDITFKITSNLAYASSRLGSGYTLNGNLYIKNNWSSNIALKTSSESWSGTTKHYKTVTLTIDDLTSTDTLLENIKFRVVSSASDKAAGLNATACSNIEIPIGHTPPLITSFTTQEMNPLLSGVSANTIVENLSILRFIVNYELYDNASVLRTGIYNNIYSYTTNNFTIIQPGQLRFDLDCSQINFYVDDNKIPIVTRVIDSFETQGVSSPLSQSTMFNRIPYVKPYILETNTKAQRLGQTSGRVGLTINGTFYNNDIGNTTQEIKIYYKYWLAGSDEPQSYQLTNVIPNENVTISGNNFEVSAYDIGNSDEQATNWFNPEEAYRIKVKVVDSFTEYESSELSIPVGESVWDEHKDHVDFKKLTVKEEVILPTKIIYTTPTTDITFSSTDDVKVPLEENIQIGDSFSISNDDGIVIGADVNVIKINAQIWFSTGFNSGDSCRLSIYKNNDRIAEAGTRAENSNAYESISIVSKLLEVQQGDIIYMYGRNATGGRGSCSNTDNIAFLTIERLS